MVTGLKPQVDEARGFPFQFLDKCPTQVIDKPCPRVSFLEDEAMGSKPLTRFLPGMAVAIAAMSTIASANNLTQVDTQAIRG